MIWSSLIAVTALLSQVNGMFNNNEGLSEDAAYWVGDPYSLTWSSNVIDSSEVSVVLRYGEGLKSEWRIIANQPNTDSSYNITVGDDLSDSVGQLLINNQTRGQFRLEVPSSVNNSNLTTSWYYNLTTVIDVAQTVIVQSIQGRVVANSGRFSYDDFRVRVRKDTYQRLNKRDDTVRWYAYLVNVNGENMTWTVGDKAGLADGETKSPTSMPSYNPTVQPTFAPTLNNSNNTNNLTREIELASLIDTNSNNNNKNKPKQTSHTYTTSSPNNNNNNNNHGRRLQQLTWNVELGETGNVNALQLGCDDILNRNDTYCEFSLTFTIPASSAPGGPFFLAVGLKQESQSSEPLQYYALNGGSDALVEAYQFVVYDTEEINIDLRYEMVNDTLIFKYENVSMDVSIGENLTEPDVFVTLYERSMDAYYYLECEAHPAPYYTSFGWKTTDENYKNTSLPPGFYEMELYWGGVTFAEAIRNSDLFKFETNNTLPTFRLANEYNGTSRAAVTIDKNKFKRGKTAKVMFDTSFNNNTMLTVWVQQCDYSENSNKSDPCTDYLDTMFNFSSIVGGVEQEVSFPKQLSKSSLENNETVTNLVITTPLCIEDTELTTIIPIAITSSSSNKSSGLSAGAIVGIVCAGVLVLGLAAWWLCMKKGGGDQYRELDG